MNGDKDTVQTPPKDGYDILVDHVTPEYPDISRGKLLRVIKEDPEVRENVLRDFHKSNYYDRSFYTFREQFYKKFGNPDDDRQVDAIGDPILKEEKPIDFVPQEESAPEVNTEIEKPAQKIPVGLLPFDLSQYGTETEQETARVAKKYTFDDKKMEQIRRNKYKAAYEDIVQTRQGDYETPADLMSLNDEKAKEAWRRTFRRSPMEIYMGLKKGDATMSTFEKGMGLLSDDMQTIPQAITHLRNELEDKYGSDVIELIQKNDEETEGLRAAVVADPIWQEASSLTKLLKETQKRASEYMKQPEFAPVREMYSRERQAQRLADYAITGDDPRGAQRYLSGLVARRLATLSRGVGNLMDTAENAIGKDENYGAWDLAEDFFIDLGRDIDKYMFPLPTAGQRGIRTQQAPWKIDGKDVTVDYGKDGKPTAIRYPNGNLYPKQIDDLTSRQKKALEQMDPSGKFNWASAAIKAGEVLGDLAVQVSTTRGLGNVGMAAGLGQRTAGTVGLTAAVSGQMIEPVYEAMKESMGDTPEAARAALLAVMGVGVGSTFFGLEKQLAGMGAQGQKTAVDIIKEAVESVGKVKPWTKAGRGAGQVIKTGVGETFEETIQEQMILNTAAGVFGASVEQPGREEIAETALLSFVTGIIGGAGSIDTKPTYLQGQALWIASSNPDQYEKAFREAIDNGIVQLPEGLTSEEYASRQRQRVVDIAKQLEAVKDRIPDDLDMGEFTQLLDERIRVKRNIDQAKALEWGRTKTEELEQQLERLNEQMEKSLRTAKVTIPAGPPKPSPEVSFLPDPVEELEPEVERAALEGSRAGVDGRLGTIERDGDNYQVVTDMGTTLQTFPVTDDPLDHNVRIRQANNYTDKSLEELEGTIVSKGRYRGPVVKDEETGMYYVQDRATGIEYELGKEGTGADFELVESPGRRVVYNSREDLTVGERNYTVEGENKNDAGQTVSLRVRDNETGALRTIRQPEVVNQVARRENPITDENVEEVNQQLTDQVVKETETTVDEVTAADNIVANGMTESVNKLLNSDEMYDAMESGQAQTIQEYVQNPETEVTEDDLVEAIIWAEQTIDQLLDSGIEGEYVEGLIDSIEEFRKTISDGFQESGRKAEEILAEARQAQEEAQEETTIDEQETQTDEEATQPTVQEEPVTEEQVEETGVETEAEEGAVEEVPVEEELPEAFPEATIDDLPGGDIEEGEVNEKVGAQLDLAVALQDGNWNNRDHKELEAMVSDIGHPELDQMLEKFRALPEHPNNYGPNEPNAEELAESFQNHKRRFINDLNEWAGMDPEVVLDLQQGEEFDQDDVNADIEALAGEYEAQAWEKAAERVRQELGEVDPDMEAAVEEAERMEKDEPLPDIPPVSEVEQDMENWAEMSDTELIDLRNRTTEQIASTQKQLSRAEQEASDEAMDMVMYSYEDDFSHSKYVKEQVAPYRQRLKKLKDNRRQIDKIIEERRQDPGVREAVENDESGVVVNNDIGFFGMGLEYLSAIFDVAYDFLMNSPKTAKFRATIGVGSAKSTIFLKSLLFTSGHMGNYRIWSLDQDRKNEILGYTSRAKFIDKRFKKKVRQHLPELTKEEARDLDNILKHPDLFYKNEAALNVGERGVVVSHGPRGTKELPRPSAWTLSSGREVHPEIIESLRDMRNLVGRLSKALIDAGVVDGDLVTIITENLNTYVTRQYEAHFNDRWAAQISADKSDASVWGRARNWARGHLQKLEDTYFTYQSEAATQVQKYEEQIANGNASAIAKLDYWQKVLDDYTQQLQKVRMDQQNLDGYVMGLLVDQTEKLTGTAGAKKGSLGSKPMGILKERAGAVKRPERRKVEQKIARAEERYKKLQKKRNQLEKIADQKRQQGSRVPLKLRDKKQAAQRQKNKYKARKKRLEERLANMDDPPQRLKDKVDFYQQKVDHYQQIADDITAEMKAVKAQEPASVEQIEQRMEAVEAKMRETQDRIIDLANELDRINQMDIPKEIRDLWGEVKDPSMNFVTTVHKQAHLLANHKFLTNLRAQGMDKFLFVSAPNPKYAYEIAAPSSSTMAPLNGLRTSREIKEVFESYNQTSGMGNAYTAFSYYSASIKKNLTVLYHLVGLRNLFGAAWSFQGMQGDYTRGVASLLNWMFLDGNVLGVGLRAAGVGKIAEGQRGDVEATEQPSLMDKMYARWGTPTGNKIYDYLKSVGLGIAQSFVPDATVMKDVTKARQMTFGVDVWNLTPHKMEAEYEDANRRGLWDEDFTFGAYRDAMEQYGKQEKPTGLLTKQDDPAKRVVTAAGNTIQFLHEKSVDRYRSSDNAGRYFRYLTEQRKYARALYGKNIDQLTDQELEHVKNIAAELAKRLYPTISRVPKAFKELSKQILIGDFVTFPVAMMQVQYNTVKQGVSELKDPRTAGMGVMRLVGVATVDMLTKAAFDGAAQLLQGAFSGDPDDEEEVRREFVASFSDNSSLTIMPAYNDDGSINPEEFYAIDHSSQSPGTITTRPIGQAIDLVFGKDGKYRSPKHKLQKSIEESLMPFVSTGIAFQAVLEAALNKRNLEREGKITPDEATLKEKIVDRVGHALGLPKVERRKVGPWNEFPVPDIKPGGIVPGTIGMANRTIRSLVGEPTSYGVVHNPYHEALSWAIGTRITKYDIPTSMGFKHRGIEESIQSIGGDWNQLPYRNYLSTLPDEEFWKHPDVTRQMESTQRMFEKVLAEAIINDMAAEEVGIPYETRLDVLRKSYSNFNKYVVAAILDRKYVQYNFYAKDKEGRRRSPAPSIRVGDLYKDISQNVDEGADQSKE